MPVTLSDHQDQNPKFSQSGHNARHGSAHPLRGRIPVQIVSLQEKALLSTWGRGWVTAEGEQVLEWTTQRCGMPITSLWSFLGPRSSSRGHVQGHMRARLSAMDFFAGSVTTSEGLSVHMGRRQGHSRGRAHTLQNGSHRATARQSRFAGPSSDPGA